jgi:hypothetical protein
MSKPTVVRVHLPVSPPNASEVLVYDKDRSFRLILDKTTLPAHVRHILHRYPNAYFTASVTTAVTGPAIVFHHHVGGLAW